MSNHIHDLCPSCGLMNGQHRGVTGNWLGCDVARFVDIGTRRQPTEPQRWNDPHAEVTGAVRAALVDGSISTRLEIDMAHYSNDEQLNIASAIVRVAVSTYIAQLAANPPASRVAPSWIRTAVAELYAALVMVRDADNDCRRDGHPSMPLAARKRIDAAIRLADGGM